jgi:hypothetical protein
MLARRLLSPRADLCISCFDLTKLAQEDRQSRRERIADYQRRYRAKNRDRIAEQKRRYHEENRDQRADYQRRYREANRDRIAEQRRRYRAENRDRIADYQHRYYMENRDRLAEWKRQKLELCPDCQREMLNYDDCVLVCPVCHHVKYRSTTCHKKGGKAYSPSR